MNEPPAPKVSSTFIACTFLISVLARDWNAAGGQQRVAEDDRADRVLVLGDADAAVVVGERAEVVIGDEAIERHRRAGGALELGRGAIGLDVELIVEHRHTAAHLLR